jgi:hypothetical protein
MEKLLRALAEDVSRIAPGPATLGARLNRFRLGDRRPDEFPLLVGEVHPQSQITNEISRRSFDRRPTVSDRRSRT